MNQRHEHPRPRPRHPGDDTGGIPPYAPRNAMTTIEAQVPDYLAREAAAKENVSVDQIVALALASQVSAWGVRDDMATRAARGKLVDFDLILSKVPDVPPQPGNELPPGYVSPLTP